MKRLIQICSILSLVVLFSAVSAKAQTVRQYSAQIPFDFNIGHKSYQAGHYVFKISPISLMGVAMSVQDGKKNNLQTIVLNGNNDVSKGEPELVFNHSGNQRFLTKLLTKEMGLPVAISNKENRQIESKAQSVPVTPKER